MSDDPASIEAWQEQEKSDIVARLRVINHHTKKLAENESLHDLYRDAFTRCENLTWEAANEIERLRKRLRQENATLTAERDEARREVCEADTDTHGGALLEAERRGWNCFKENTNGR